MFRHRRGNMDTKTCNWCNRTFSKPSNLKRHIRLFHNNKPIHDTLPSEGCIPQDTVPCTFKHPFTMIVSGPTGCGKTQWIYNLLTRDLIHPSPQRIFIFYKRWQPLYDCMRNIPNVE